MARKNPPSSSETNEEDASEVLVTGLIQRTLELKQKYEMMEAFPEPAEPAPEPEEANAVYKFKVMEAPAAPTPPAPTLSDMNK